MTIYELCEYYIEGSDEIQIWSTDEHETVFKGTVEEAMISEYADSSICSFGVEAGTLVINI